MKRIKPIEDDASASSKELDTLEERFEEFSSLAGEWLLLEGDQLLARSRPSVELSTPKLRSAVLKTASSITFLLRLNAISS